MTTEFSAVSSVATHDERVVHQSHSNTCDCITCIQEALGPYPEPLLSKAELEEESNTSMAPFDPSDFSDSEPTSSSPPSTPSTGSIRSKRAWPSDGEQSSSDSEPDQKRVKTRSSSPTPDHHLRLPQPDDDFLDFCEHRGTAFVDKTQCIPQLPDRFQCLLLRPPRFGKTTFLSTLNHYYDIRGAKHFARRFGSLAVVTEAPDANLRHSQHLCLSFNLSDVYVHSNITEIASQLADQIAFVLCVFLITYAKELGLSDPETFLGDRSGNLFAKVFELVKARGHTLFVGVDDYDAPTRIRSSAHLQYNLIHARFASARDIEQVLDTHFWGPLLAGSDVIKKLFVTGTLLVKYPALENLHMLGLHATPSLQRSCGFTEQEALNLARSVLEETPDVAEVRRLYGGYVFSSQDAGTVVVEPLLHPQRIIARISELSLQRADANGKSFKLLSDLLGLLPEKSNVSGAASLNGLIDLLATGIVEIDETEGALGFDATAVTWNALYHAGALTHGPHLEGTFRVANSGALSVIHARIDTLFADWHDLRHEFLNPWSSYSMGDEPEAFLELLSQVLRDLAQASLGRKHEPDMRGVLELVMRNSHTLPSRVIAPIILFPYNVPGKGIRIEIPGYRKVHVWDVNTLTLLGMWRAINLNDDTPTVEALQKLHEELVQDDEEHLLARPYRVWSPTLNAMETRLVGSFFDPEPENPQFLAVGGARVLLRQRPSVPEPSDAADVDPSIPEASDLDTDWFD
ncbi:hypothetical protein DFH09DRAFT_1205999 [Mycena vulgaris]|nr:hypothetical protein DFH09DRAFT_1205999 [Mycena vulgaris]